MKKIFVLLVLLIAGQAKAQLTVAAGGTGRTWTIPYGVVVGGTLSSDALQQVSPGDSLKFLQSMGPGLLPTWVTAGTISTPVSIANGGTNGTTAAAGIKNLVPDTTGKTNQLFSVKAGGGITWQALNSLLIKLSDTAGNTGNRLTVKPGGGFDWESPTNLTVRSITAAVTIAAADQSGVVTVDSTYDITLPLANSVLKGHGVWIVDNFAMDGTQSGTRNILPSGSDHLIIHHAVVTTQAIAQNQYQSGYWISDGVSRWYCITYTTSAL